MFSDKQIPQNFVEQKDVNNEEIVLPLEVVSHIMEFLPYLDRVASRQVCQVWYQASIKRKLLDKERVVFKRMVLDDNSTALNVIDGSFRPFLHFVFIELELTSKMKRFWANAGPEMRSLSIENCDLTERMLIEILRNCSQLEELKINNCREPLISGRLLDDQEDVQELKNVLRNVRKLSLCYNRYLSDALFNRFITVMENVDSLSLAGCQISFHPGLYKKFYPNKLLSVDSSYASETVLTFLNVMHFIRRNCNRFKSLDFSNTLMNSRCLTQIAELPTVSLTELYLQNCEQLTNSGVLAVTQHQCAMVVLDLSGCSRVTDQSLINISLRLKRLQKLRVRNCRAITDLGVIQLKNLHQLTCVDLSQCEQVTGAAIETAFVSENGQSKMKELCLRALNRLNENTIIFVIEHLKSITKLDISYCFSAITDRSIQVIFKHLILLRSLKLANCDAVTDAGLTGIYADGESSNSTNNDSGLSKNMYISLGCKAEEDIIRDAKRKETVKLMCEGINRNQTYSLSSLAGLQELDIQSCNRITDVSLEYALTLNELQQLNLSRCQQITDVGLAFVATNNPSIDTINLSNCDNISDEGIKALVMSLHRLRYIDIQGCKHLTNCSLSAIKTYCPGLRYLDITNCKINVDTIDMTSMPALHTLHSSTVVY